MAGAGGLSFVFMVDVFVSEFSNFVFKANRKGAQSAASPSATNQPQTEISQGFHIPV